jgi:Protein of unknown function (DUF2914)
MMKLASLARVAVLAMGLLAVPFSAHADGKTTPAGGSASTAAKRLGVKRLVLAHGIDGHEPQDASGTFKSSDDRIYAFVELENPAKAGTAITVVFEPPSGPPVAEIPLTVGETPRFRTWAFTRKARTSGEWTVVVRDDQHRILARQTFTVS